jgi:glycosyltransferase involved in cell wall biosynthesis
MGERLDALSVFVTTLNEEANIERCLRSVAWAGEVLVLDSGSTDTTRALARELADRVETKEWSGYSEQKAYALSLLTRPWALWLDADEEVSPALAAEIREALADPGERFGFTMPRLSFYMGRWVRHGGWYPDRKLRLFRRDHVRFDGRLVHEAALVDGPVGELEHDLLHYSYRDMSHHLAKMDALASLAARDMMERGRRATVFDLALRPAAGFLRSYLLRAGFLDGRAGFVAAMMSGFYDFLKHAKLRELRRQSNRPGPGSSPAVR